MAGVIEHLVSLKHARRRMIAAVDISIDDDRSDEHRADAALDIAECRGIINKTIDEMFGLE